MSTDQATRTEDPVIDELENLGSGVKYLPEEQWQQYVEMARKGHSRLRLVGMRFSPTVEYNRDGNFFTFIEPPQPAY
ncbi:MAG: hypothetical protein KKF56_05800 [Nanoarchaeota archaeon]|nr:hypothetical protein [Nanoarchaeota archaeon]